MRTVNEIEVIRELASRNMSMAKCYWTKDEEKAIYYKGVVAALDWVMEQSDNRYREIPYKK